MDSLNQVEVSESELIHSLKLTISRLSGILESIPMNSVRHKKKKEQLSGMVGELEKDIQLLFSSFEKRSSEKIGISTHDVLRVEEFKVSKLEATNEMLRVKNQYLQLLQENALLKNENINIERQYTTLLRSHVSLEQEKEVLNQKNMANENKLERTVMHIHSLQNKYEDLLRKVDDIGFNNNTLLGKYLDLQETYLENVVQIDSVSVNRGALDLVRSSISYKLGQTLVKNSTNRTFGKIPKEMLGVLKNFLLIKAQEEMVSMSHLEDYIDSDEAELSKQHLSYRLGRVIVENILLSNNVQKLPLDFFEEIVAFKKSNRNKLK